MRPRARNGVWWFLTPPEAARSTFLRQALLVAMARTHVGPDERIPTHPRTARSGIYLEKKSSTRRKFSLSSGFVHYIYFSNSLRTTDNTTALSRENESLCSECLNRFWKLCCEYQVNWWSSAVRIGSKLAIIRPRLPSIVKLCKIVFEEKGILTDMK